MKVKASLVAVVMLLASLSLAVLSQGGAVDPGVRGGPAGAGGPRVGLNDDYTILFNQALVRFEGINSVSGVQSGVTDSGLGPRFNGIGCAACHVAPAVGGGSPATGNPQIGFASVFGGTNVVPSFILDNGPIREARFVRNRDGSPDGGVHDLFVITGMPDAPGCNIKQPDFADALEDHNVIFRIPISIFGDGLVEEVTDSNLLANLAANAHEKHELGIYGRPNRNGNDGTISRFGWKAQNQSLLLFSGEAYNVEQGVTNFLFPNERDDTPGCLFNPLHEDSMKFETEPGSLSPTSDFNADIDNFAVFMELTAPAKPAPDTPSTLNGRALFSQVGCAFCHTPTLTTGKDVVSLLTGLKNETLNPFSDFMLHKMGEKLEDGVSQQQAKGDEFRTAPLWGIGQRVFFLHDGRTSDLLEAIAQHRSHGSEANKVIESFNALSSKQKQDILNFLRGL